MKRRDVDLLFRNPAAWLLAVTTAAAIAQAAVYRRSRKRPRSR